MATVSASIEIARPVEYVFAFAGDCRNDVYWRRGVIGMECEPPGVPAAGSITRERMVVLGELKITIARVTEFDYGHRTAFEAVEGPVPCHGFRQFEATDSGTRFHYSLTIRSRGVYLFAGLPLKLMFAKKVRADLRRLKTLLEQEEPVLQTTLLTPPQISSL